MLNYIHDSQRRMIGWTQISSNGFTYLYNARGQMKGWYQPKSNQTFTQGGQLVGWDNQLMMLLN